MLQHCNKRFRVYKSAHKTCDTIELYVIRRMSNAVHLDELRCDGAAHGGCQAACLIFWKEAWLKRVPPGDTQETPLLEPEVSVDALYRDTVAAADPPSVEPRYRCQATDLLKATSQVRRRERWMPQFYVKDLTSGNVKVADFVWYGLRAALNAFTLKGFGRRFPHMRGLAKDRTPTANLNLQAGELIQVRSKSEIMQTLTPQFKNRGLWFDVEMVPFCDSTFRVLRRVERIIDEKTGRMIVLPNPCLMLEGVVCSGHHSAARMFCPRAIYPYWREVWLKRVEPSDTRT
jgi:hypothetical protein